MESVGSYGIFPSNYTNIIVPLSLSLPFWVTLMSAQFRYRDFARARAWRFQNTNVFPEIFDFIVGKCLPVYILRIHICYFDFTGFRDMYIQVVGSICNIILCYCSWWRICRGRCCESTVKA